MQTVFLKSYLIKKSNLTLTLALSSTIDNRFSFYFFSSWWTSPFFFNYFFNQRLSNYTKIFRSSVQQQRSNLQTRQQMLPIVAEKKLLINLLLRMCRKCPLLERGFQNLVHACYMKYSYQNVRILYLNFCDELFQMDTKGDETVNVH